MGCGRDHQKTELDLGQGSWNKSVCETATYTLETDGHKVRERTGRETWRAEAAEETERGAGEQQRKGKKARTERRPEGKLVDAARHTRVEGGEHV
jgi:hypothetical protein